MHLVFWPPQAYATLDTFALVEVQPQVQDLPARHGLQTIMRMVVYVREVDFVQLARLSRPHAPLVLSVT